MECLSFVFLAHLRVSPPQRGHSLLTSAFGTWMLFFLAWWSMQTLTPSQPVLIVSEKSFFLVVKKRKTHSRFWMACVIISVADCLGDFSSRIVELNILSTEVVGLNERTVSSVFWRSLCQWTSGLLPLLSEELWVDYLSCNEGPAFLVRQLGDCGSGLGIALG